MIRISTPYEQLRVQELELTADFDAVDADAGRLVNILVRCGKKLTDLWFPGVAWVTAAKVKSLPLSAATFSCAHWAHLLPYTRRNRPGELEIR